MDSEYESDDMSTAFDTNNTLVLEDSTLPLLQKNKDSLDTLISKIANKHTDQTKKNSDKLNNTYNTSFDFNLLLSNDGFPFLLENNACMVNSLEGCESRELEDLRIIIQYYREWQHKIRPKIKFQDFCHKIEQISKTKTAKSYFDSLLSKNYDF